MRTEALAIRSWDDLVFENRHKEYGAYSIRQAYARHISIALTTIVTTTLLAVILPRILPSSTLDIIKPHTTDSGLIVMDDIRIEPPRIAEPPRPRQVAPADAPSHQPPRVTHEEVTEVIPTNDELNAFTEPADNTGTPGDGAPTGETGSTDLPVVSLTTEPVTYAPVMPAYKGGFEAMAKFIGKHMKYPASARRTELEGSVFVSFVINAAGNVTDVKVVRGISADCDKEAIRVISMMPDWDAGRQSNDMPVPVRMILPIKFAFNRN